MGNFMRILRYARKMRFAHFLYTFGGNVQNGKRRVILHFPFSILNYATNPQEGGLIY